MGIVVSLPCCTERDRSQLRPAKVVTSKSMGNMNKIGQDDEYAEMYRNLNSVERISNSNVDFRHDWASRPESVASVSAWSLAEKLRSPNSASMRLHYIKAGCLTPLVNLLIDGSSVDKIHAAVIALLSITNRCSDQEQVVDELIQLDTVAIVTKYISDESQNAQLRHACCEIVFNILGTNRGLAADFSNSKGVEALANLLVLGGTSDDLIKDRLVNCSHLIDVGVVNLEKLKSPLTQLQEMSDFKSISTNLLSRIN
jgi:hypothetical protein